MDRGLAAGVAPMPERSEFRPVPAPFTLGELTFGPGSELSFRGSRRPWTEAFVVGGLSKGPGPIGCFQHADRRTTWILHEGGPWLAATVEAAPLPAIAKTSEPETAPVPEEVTIVYEWVGKEFEEKGITGYPGGFFSVFGHQFRTGQDTDFTCPATNGRVQVRGDVVCITTGNIYQRFKYANPSILQRLLTSPTGWYWISVAIGRQTRFNSLASCAFWHPLNALAIILIGAFALFKSFPLLVLWVILMSLAPPIILFHPGRRHLPSWFFKDGAEEFFEARRIYKAIKAGPLTHLSYLSAIHGNAR